MERGYIEEGDSSRTAGSEGDTGGIGTGEREEHALSSGTHSRGDSDRQSARVRESPQTTFRVVCSARSSSSSFCPEAGWLLAEKEPPREKRWPTLLSHSYEFRRGVRIRDDHLLLLSRRSIKEERRGGERGFETLRDDREIQKLCLCVTRHRR